MFLDDRQRLREPFERRLSRRLVEEGQVDEAGLRKALDRQLVHGGHLATALWELGLVGFRPLMELSAELLGMPAVDPRAVERVPPRLLRIFPPEFAASRRILPLAVEGKTLAVATSEPWDLPALEEALRKTGLRLKPHFLPEVALVRLLDRLYGIPASPRFRVGAAAKRGRTEPSATTGPELMSEEAFASLYQRAEEPSVGPRVEASAASEGEAAAPGEENLPLIEVEAPQHRELEAIGTLEEAEAALDRALSRDEIGRAMARFALAGARRVVLLAYEAGVWTGWTGAGLDVDPVAVRRLMVPSAEGTVFGIVGSTGAHYLGPLAEHPIHRRFLEALGTGRPEIVGLLPVHYKGRLVYGVYIDTEVNPGHLGALLLLAQKVPRALERLVERRLRRGE